MNLSIRLLSNLGSLVLACITKINQAFHYGACVNCRINFDVIRVKIRNSYRINFSEMTRAVKMKGVKLENRS